MAWIEQTGQCSWRVRYRTKSGTYWSQSGFGSHRAAEEYIEELRTDQRRGIWLDPSGARMRLGEWVNTWIDTIDVEPRTEENYRRCLRLHILPRWGNVPLGDITASAVTLWLKELRERYAAATVRTMQKMLSMIMDDATDERLISANPVRRRRRRGRRRDRSAAPKERVWATPDQVLRIAEQAAMLGGRSAGLLVITAAWTGCRWGEVAGLHRDELDLDRGTITIDPDIGALHESARQLWLGPPKTPASARTIMLPHFLIALLREHLAHRDGWLVFTSPRGYALRRSDFDRRVFRPSVDGNPRKGTTVVRPGLTFHGLRHSHKTWLIADGIPEIAQAKRLGHHLASRLTEVYSHVAPEIETRLLRGLERRWKQATSRRPVDNRPGARHRGGRDPHTAPAQRTKCQTETPGQPSKPANTVTRPASENRSRIAPSGRT